MEELGSLLKLLTWVLEIHWRLGRLASRVFRIRIFIQEVLLDRS